MVLSQARSLRGLRHMDSPGNAMQGAVWKRECPTRWDRRRCPSVWTTVLLMHSKGYERYEHLEFLSGRLDDTRTEAVLRDPVHPYRIEADPRHAVRNRADRDYSRCWSGVPAVVRPIGLEPPA